MNIWMRGERPISLHDCAEMAQNSSLPDAKEDTQSFYAVKYVTLILAIGAKIALKCTAIFRVH